MKSAIQPLAGEKAPSANCPTLGAYLLRSSLCLLICLLVCLAMLALSALPGGSYVESTLTLRADMTKAAALGLDTQLGTALDTLASALDSALAQRIAGMKGQVALTRISFTRERVVSLTLRHHDSVTLDSLMKEIALPLRETLISTLNRLVEKKLDTSQETEELQELVKKGGAYFRNRAAENILKGLDTTGSEQSKALFQGAAAQRLVQEWGQILAADYTGKLVTQIQMEQVEARLRQRIQEAFRARGSLEKIPELISQPDITMVSSTGLKRLGKSLSMLIFCAMALSVFLLASASAMTCCRKGDSGAEA